MKNTLLFALLLFPLFIYPQGINLNIGEHLYNRIQKVIPIEDGGWLVVADVSNVENGYEIRPRLLRVSNQNNSSCINVDIINAVNAPTALTQLNVYPNPTAGTFHFSNTEQWEQYELYDARGQTVQSAPLPPGETTVQLDLTKLPAGLYHLVLNRGSGKALARVVKK
jgi:hypothetical protein